MNLLPKVICYVTQEAGILAVKAETSDDAVSATLPVLGLHSFHSSLESHPASHTAVQHLTVLRGSYIL